MVEKSGLSTQGDSGQGARREYKNRFEGTRTPMHDVSGAKTPAWNSLSSGWSGNKTPAWDSASKTPAWDSGSKTPAWDSGSKTPAWESADRSQDAFTQNMDSNMEIWLLPDILVKIDKTSEICVVKSVSNARATLITPSQTEIILLQSQMLPVPPSKKDSFKVIRGEYRGKLGQLLSIDGDVGVVKLEGNDEIIMMNLDSIAKIKQ